jgi:hypothetical protein
MTMIRLPPLVHAVSSASSCRPHTVSGLHRRAHETFTIHGLVENLQVHHVLSRRPPYGT